MLRTAPPTPLSRLASIVGATACLVALVTIWSARASVQASVYVSGLGAPSMPTADVFNSALLVLAAGGLLAAAGARGVRSRSRVLGAWSVAASLATSGAAFAVASRVTCTDGCPVPFTPSSTGQDLIHVVVAVVGFAAAAWAMLQVATSDGPAWLRRASILAGAAVGAVAAAGGLMSVFAFHPGVGATLEFVAMTIAVLWLAAFAAGRALDRAVTAVVARSPRGARLQPLGGRA